MADRIFNRNLDPQLRHRLGRFFQDGRNKQGLTQEQLANQVGLTTKTISFIENGKTYGFDTKQREQLGELLSDRNKEMWDGLLS